MAEVLRPQFFVTRQNGAMVPLIAVDELPPDLTLVDVPRELTSHDIHDMKGVGTHQNRHRRYIIERLRGREQANSPTIPEALANPNIDVQSRRLPHALHEIHQKYHGVAESVPTNSISLRPYDQQAVYPVNHPPATYPYNATNNVSVVVDRHFLAKALLTSCPLGSRYPAPLSYPREHPYNPLSQERVLLLLAPPWRMRLCPTRLFVQA